MSLVISGGAATATPFTYVTPSLTTLPSALATSAGQPVRIKRLALAVFGVKTHTGKHTQSLGLSLCHLPL